MAGRSRKDGARHPCGKLVQEPSAPPKALDQRALLVGDGKKSDPRAGFPIGVLYLRRAILHGDYVAAMRFAGLYAQVWGKGAIKSHIEAVMTGLRGRRWDDADAAEREKIQIRLAGELGEATAKLLSLSTRRPYQVLVNLAVYEHPMRFMDTARARTPAAWAADERDREALCEATACLAALWGIERKSAA